MTRPPYRVAVWGPGVLGTALLREVVAKPELELVGVLCYSDRRKGLDVGAYLGGDPIGVAMTTDKNAVVALRPDVVLFCPQATAGAALGSEATQDVLRLLRNGTNVIAANGYHHPAFDPELEAALVAACEEGGSTIHGTGVNPGLLCERILTTLTAVCTRIDSILVQEVGVGATVDSPDMMSMIGWGQQPPPMQLIVDMAARYYGESLTHACAILGREVDRIEADFSYVLADRDYQVGTMLVPAGTMGAVQHAFTAVVEDRPFLRLEEHFIAHPDLAPIPLPAPDHWTITVEGAPTSVRMQLEMQHSFARNQRYAEGDSTPAAYYATAVPMLQAIPLVVAGRPGVLEPEIWTRSVPDLRTLATAG